MDFLSIDLNSVFRKMPSTKVQHYPELLEALQLIFKHYDRNNGESPHHCHLHKAHWDIDDAVCEVCADWEKARAAIAKATQ